MERSRPRLFPDRPLRPGPRLSMPYGKYRGTPLDELPRDYLEWLHFNCLDDDGYSTLPPGLREAVKDELTRRDGANGHNGRNDHDGSRDGRSDGAGPGVRPPRGTSVRNGSGHQLHPRYADFLANVRNGIDGYWVPLPASWCRTFGVRLAGVLAHLLNAAQLYADARGWMECEPTLLERRLGLSEAAQEKLLADLEEDGVVTLTWRDGCRFVRIDTDRIEELVTEEGLS